MICFPRSRGFVPERTINYSPFLYLSLSLSLSLSFLYGGFIAGSFSEPALVMNFFRAAEPFRRLSTFRPSVTAARLVDSLASWFSSRHWLLSLGSIFSPLYRSIEVS